MSLYGLDINRQGGRWFDLFAQIFDVGAHKFGATGVAWVIPYVLQ